MMIKYRDFNDRNKNNCSFCDNWADNLYYWLQPSDQTHPPGPSTVTGRCLLESVRAPATLTESSIFINIAATTTDMFQERDTELTSRKFKIWNGKKKPDVFTESVIMFRPDELSFN